MEPDDAWLLVVVDGPSEADARSFSSGEPFSPQGVVGRLIAYIFGAEVYSHTRFEYWSKLRVPSPRRGIGASLRGYDAKATWLAHLAHQTTAYGLVLLADNDHGGHPGRLASLEQGIKDAGDEAAQRCAVGVAVEMIEAWLLSDPQLLEPPSLPLPAGRRPEQLWGDKHDPQSNYPKHVLRRCVCEPRGWHYRDAIDAWEPLRAEEISPSLRAFIGSVRRLAESQGCV
jgi:hypothetical protein